MAAACRASSSDMPWVSNLWLTPNLGRLKKGFGISSLAASI